MLRRHAPDVVSLVFGTLFAGFAVIWLLNATDVIDYQEAWLAGPAILIVAGVLGLVVALRPSEAAPPAVPWERESGGVAEASTLPDAPDAGTADRTVTETDQTTPLPTEHERDPRQPPG
jgi:hypothetical protein